MAVHSGLRAARIAPDSRSSRLVHEVAVFRVEGEMWRIEFAGKRIRLPDSKGLRDLALLLRHPGRDIPATDLVAATSAAPGKSSPTFHDAATAVAYGLGDAGEVLDARAAASYRRRLKELRSALQEGRVPQDSERSIREEIDFLTAELGSAFGRGGRPRRAAAASERARKAVANRIRAAIDRIVEEHRELGHHLGSNLRLGLSCSYLPDDSIVWDV